MISILENDIDIASKKHNLVQFKDYFVKMSWLRISANIRHQSPIKSQMRVLETKPNQKIMKIKC